MSVTFVPGVEALFRPTLKYNGELLSRSKLSDLVAGLHGIHVQVRMQFDQNRLGDTSLATKSTFTWAEMV